MTQSQNVLYLSLGLTIASGVLYHVAQRATPKTVNPALSILVSYVTAAIITIIVLPMFSQKGALVAGVKELTWTTYALGLAIVGVEIGFLLAYRAGWNVSMGAVISNVAVIILLIPIGILHFKEHLTGTNYAGIVLCLVGLSLVLQK